jgi:phage-related protein
VSRLSEGVCLVTVSGFIPRSNSLDGMVFDSPALRIQYNPRSKTGSPEDRRGTALVSHTKKLYTSQNDSSIVRRGQVRERPTAEIVWEGNSHKVLKGFPESPRANLGHLLWLVQLGIEAPGSSTVPGLDGVFELRDQDERAWYRILYLKQIKGRILSCIASKSNQTALRNGTSKRRKNVSSK